MNLPELRSINLPAIDAAIMQQRMGEQQVQAMQAKNALAPFLQRQAQMEMEAAALEMEGKRAQMADQQKVRDFYGNIGQFMPSRSSAALGAGAQTGDIGPTVTNASRMDTMPEPVFNANAMYRAMVGSGSPSLAQAGLAALSKEDESIVVGEGGALVNKRTGTQLFNNPKTEKPLELERMLDAAGITDPRQRAAIVTQAITKQTTHAPGVSVSYGAPVAGVDANGNPVYFQPSKNGGAPAIIPGVKPQGETGKPPTEFEAKAGLYFKSMQQASQTLGNIETNGNPLPQPGEALIPSQTVANVIRNPERQAYVQAQRQWIDSINRVRSGANLPELEYERAVMTFFPQFGDRPEVVKQKAIARASEETAMATAAGRALKPGDAAGSGGQQPAAGILAMPTRKASLVVGQTYRTPRGIAKWDGTDFVKE
jgi:hypothetical protein